MNCACCERPLKPPTRWKPASDLCRRCQSEGLSYAPDLWRDRIKKWDAEKVQALIDRKPLGKEDLDTLIRYFIVRMKVWAKAVLTQNAMFTEGNGRQIFRNDLLAELLTEAAGMAVLRLDKLLERIDDVEHLSNSLELSCKEAMYKWLCEQSGTVKLPQGVVKRKALKEDDLQRRQGIETKNEKDSTHTKLSGLQPTGASNRPERFNDAYWDAVKRLVDVVTEQAEKSPSRLIVVPICRLIRWKIKVLTAVGPEVTDKDWITVGSVAAACRVVAYQLKMDPRTVQDRFDEFVRSITTNEKLMKALDFDLQRRADPTDESAFNMAARLEPEPLLESDAIDRLADAG